jgi:hypothetical protein
MKTTFKLTAPPPLEQDVHEQLVRILDRVLLPPAFWFSAAIGSIKLTPQQAARVSRAGVKRGLPDFFFVYEGLVFSIELKRPGTGRLSKTKIGRTARGTPRILAGQEDVFPLLRDAGMAIAICHTTEAALGQLKRWGLPLRGDISI